MGGYALSKERSIIFTASNPYLQASFGFCFKQGNAFIPFTRLVAVFKIKIWGLICGLLLIAMMMILLTKKLPPKWRHFIIAGRLNRSPILNMWTVVVGNPISNPYLESRRNFGTFARTLLLLWILMWFVIRNAYQSALYKYLQSHRLSSPYDTIEKIQSSDCKVITTVSGLYFLNGLIPRDR